MGYLNNCTSRYYEVPYSVSEPLNELTNMNKQAMSQTDYIEAIKSNRPYFIVGSVDSAGSLSFSANPVFHEGAQSARSECQRLSTSHPGKMFMFVKLGGAELLPYNNAISV